MATRGGEAPVQRSGRPLPSGGPAAKARPQLGVLDRRHVLIRARRRQARLLLALAAAGFAGPLVLAAAGHALVAADQVRSDALQSEIAQALQVQQDDQLQRAELMAPGRILTIAETRLHMITPPAVTYLVPVQVGPTVAEAHAQGEVALGAGRSVRAPARSTAGSRRAP